MTISLAASPRRLAMPRGMSAAELRQLAVGAYLDIRATITAEKGVRTVVSV